ncbi:Re/Si-specific NAD(P)(+) transhydrogenase subunit alpha [Legionella waltersii]|uniref:NAD(P) transhydrogenase subunit alpha part 1 n=1 Tax=Legionella waltersii TaxID=66969 RepID=A0A0W1ANM0_9GAMM|nr:Re/Si-specific NAD(P)(+) transhydrogenase subunit alpha [Legionella waltersii]KTD82864.1 pyridine nucleotide transhydrogenase, alpha subunit [Legionella waltersii]SNV01917.1 NAD(P) transhydrogenase subunit alpha [Legionella waltersii]
MMIGTILEDGSETRVSITPNTAKQYIKLGFQVGIEKNAGLKSDFHDDAYEKVGATVFDKRQDLLKQTQILLAVNEPKPKHLDGLAKEAVVIAHIDNQPENELVKWSIEHQISLFSMNLIPRISRAQSMDSLSSQANLAGYRAVIEAASQYHRAIPMMMTAAGMIQPAKVLILGAGVAGLQAIATAKRLGAVVYAFDVRRAAKEQVESLGAEFIEVAQEQDSETAGGYASETSEEYKKLQSALIDKYARMSDIVISTALIPGRPAPTLLYKATVEEMKPGSIIVDLATSRGGNCELSVKDQSIKHGEVTIIGTSNMAGQIPTTSSELYANNLIHLISLLAKSAPEIAFNPDDEIIQQAMICNKGSYMPFDKTKEKQNA